MTRIVADRPAEAPDVLAQLLDGVRARGALFGEAGLDPPWGLRFATGASVTLTTLRSGAGWVVPASGAPVAIGPGDVVLSRGPAPFTVADRPATPPPRRVTGADYCADPPGRSCRVGPRGDTVLLSGAYQGGGAVAERLLRTLPETILLPAAARPEPVLDLLATELRREGAGQQAVLDRLLDLALVSVLRAWLENAGPAAPRWHTAGADPVVGRAQALLHAAPEHPWTVAGLARATGVSRASLARRFAGAVGEPPMAYLTGWRIARAADLLRETDATVASVAREVGYADAFALSAAFKRLRGVSPSAYRRAVAG
ncbi:AraC family transcriptional regulator [Streptomyces profundus]|uniref:AraC family transcriptional regulator n=1 Tax=Streptomyces profundus TaxID=2867410 RepID=UPI001D169F6D|nr:AraC family transcriptional regulator [Streptomyces sp. MA3_2.13]UED83779.1 AraC family transcriptional regulator [Streptomyces sp. MA3_2.13]